MDVAVFIPTRGFIYAGVISRLQEEKIPFSICTGSVSWSNTMNGAVNDFLTLTESDVFVTLDDDTIPPLGWIENLVAPLEDGFDVMGAPTLLAQPGGIFLPNTYEITEGQYLHKFGHGVCAVDAVGSACMAIHRRVFNKIKAPFLESFHKNGIIDLGGDLRFCHRAKSQGFKIGANFDVLCEHFRAIHLNAAADAYVQALQLGDGS